MAISTVLFEPSLLQQVMSFEEETYGRARSESISRWRYVEFPEQKGRLIIDNHKILAMLWTTQKTYRVGSNAVSVAEPFDWACSPEQRNSGLGIVLMRQAMQEEPSLIVVGGSEDTRHLLPRLGWTIFGKSKKYVFPLSNRWISHQLEKRASLPRHLTDPVAYISCRLFFRPFIKRTGSQLRVVESYPTLEERSECLGLNARPLWTDAYAQWLTKAPQEMGSFIPLSFYRDSRLCGWSMSRIFNSSYAGLESKIVDFFGENESTLSILRETIHILRARRAEATYVATMSPPFQKALLRSRFLSYGHHPVFYYSNPGLSLPPSMDLGLNTADLPFL